MDGQRDFVYLPSLATLRSLRTSPHSKSAADSIAIFADPVFRSDDPRLHDVQSASSVNASLSAAATETGVAELPRLRHAKTEATSIAALASANEAWTALDFAANRNAVLSADWSHYRTVHFSTHSMLNLRHPELSGIVLSLYDAQGHAEDGFLRMTDVYNLRMPVDLAVLSVCDSSRETGRGAEGMFGLSRAFFYAGARRVLLSLWPTDDSASAEFMSRFYRHLFVERQSAQRALRSAQTELQAQPRWSQPYYWSGFVIQGDWR
jgi:CHAT domain-containing protein